MAWSKPFRRVEAVIAWALSMLVWTSQGNAQVSPDRSRAAARGLANDAANAYARGAYGEAAELLQRAYSLVPAPTIAVLHARTLVKLNRYVEATEAYNRALLGPIAPDSPEPFRRAVADADVELEALQPRVPKLKILVRGARIDDPALVVFLDNQALPRAMLGAWIPVDPKVHSLHAEFDGSLGASESVSLAEGSARVATVAAPDPSAALKRWGFVSLGVGGVGLGLGIVSGIIAVNAYDDAERSCDGSCVAGGAGAAALDRFETYRVVSTVSYAVGAAAIGVGGFLLLRASDRAGRSVAVVPSFQGIRVEGSL